MMKLLVMLGLDKTCSCGGDGLVWVGRRVRWVGWRGRAQEGWSWLCELGYAHFGTLNSVLCFYGGRP